MRHIIIISFLIYLVSCKNMPAYKCETKLYQLDNLPCITRLINNEPVTVCPNDSEYPKDLIGITIEDYNCNRNYADELIKSCKSWKK